MASKPASIRVYYNSACPVCRAGIEQQKEKMPSCPVQWQDVHTDHEDLKALDAELEFVRERLHVVDEYGKLNIGFDAFLTIWRHSPKEHWKATLLGLPVIKSLMSLLYNIFARLLYRWNRSKKHW